MAEKGGLNGAYYGPAIPPQKSYLRPSRGGDCLCGCGCCLIKLLLQIIFTIVIILGILALIFWLIFRPNLVKFHVTEAELTQFNFTTNNTLLNYNLKLNLTIRNPNKRIGIYYDRIEARALYEDQRFDVEDLTPFYQGHKNTTVLTPVFEGQQVVVLGSSELSDYNEDKAEGVYDIDVKLYLRVRFKLGKIKTFRFKPKINCDLKVPLSSSSGGSTIKTTTTTFETEKCDIDWRMF